MSVGISRVLGPHRPVRPVVDFPQRADDSLLDPLGNQPVAGSAAVGQQVRGDVRLAGRLDDQSSFVQPVGDRLVHQDVLALLHRRDGDGRVKMIGRHDLDGVQVLFFVQQFAEVGVGGARLELLRAPLVGVVGVDDFPAHFPAAGAAVVVFSPVGLPR